MASKLSDRRNRKDRFFRRARQQGFAARSIYKLEEIDRRFKLFKPGHRVLDLGCRPGSWMQYAAGLVGETGHVVGLDRQELSHAPDHSCALVGDVLEIDPADLRGALPEQMPGCFHVVLSDMAPDTTGITFTDQARSTELLLRALDIAALLGCPGGSFVGKLFMGEGFTDVRDRARELFGKVKMVKPDASRKSSKEQYIVASGKKPLERQSV